MKTGNLEAVSRKWQLTHLKYYFGCDRATSSVGHANLKLVVDNESDSQNDSTEAKRECSRVLESVEIGLAKAVNTYAPDQS
jgi:hypothetical protein